MTSLPPAPGAFDLARLKSAYPDLGSYRAACLQLARSAERGERYDDQARFVREVIKCTAQDGSEMTDEEKNVGSEGGRAEGWEGEGGPGTLADADGRTGGQWAAARRSDR